MQTAISVFIRSEAKTKILIRQMRIEAPQLMDHASRSFFKTIAKLKNIMNIPSNGTWAGQR
jgi:hypothetical protein